MESITFPKTSEVLKRYGERLRALYRQLMSAAGKDATGDLSRSAKYKLFVGNATITLDIELLKYWRYVEYGRRPGRFPPRDAILKWIDDKPIQPYPDSRGRIPTKDQLAYLIGRKIAFEGIEPTPILEQAVFMTNAEFLDQIDRALDEDLGNELDRSITLFFYD